MGTVRVEHCPDCGQMIGEGLLYEHQQRVHRKQIEGVKNIQQMGTDTNFWGWVDCAVGKMFLAGNDDAIAMRYYNGYVYEPSTLMLWQELCHHAELVVDVGAHTGFYSLAAFQAGAKFVVSVEPYYLNAARLQMNMRGNGIGHEWACAVCAASDEDRVVELHVPISPKGPTYFCTGASRLQPWKGAWAMPVRVRPLDAIIAQEHHASISLMKLDVEYHLLRALHGASQILTTSQPDLIFELFEPGVDAFLRPFGYQFWAIDELRGVWHQVDRLDCRDPAGSRNYFATVRPRS